jgi:RNA polymerase sigma factor for flagellar operon FliA
MFYSEKEKEALIKNFLHKIKYYALRYHFTVQSFLELEDLISAGIRGLLEALEKYDPSLNVPLASFVEYRIRGAILDEIRSVDVFSKEFRKKIEDVKKAYKELSQQGHEPTDEELITKLDISQEELQEVYHSINASDLISLDDHRMVQNGEKLNILNIIADKTDLFEEIKMKEIKEKLAKAIEKLSQQEKLVISLYYYEEMNMNEIAKILDISPSRVSQIHARSILKLRNFLSWDKL